MSFPFVGQNGINTSQPYFLGNSWNRRAAPSQMGAPLPLVQDTSFASDFSSSLGYLVVHPGLPQQSVPIWYGPYTHHHQPYVNVPRRVTRYPNQFQLPMSGASSVYCLSMTTTLPSVDGIQYNTSRLTLNVLLCNSNGETPHPHNKEYEQCQPRRNSSETDQNPLEDTLSQGTLGSLLMEAPFFTPQMESRHRKASSPRIYETKPDRRHLFEYIPDIHMNVEQTKNEMSLYLPVEDTASSIGSSALPSFISPQGENEIVLTEACRILGNDKDCKQELLQEEDDQLGERRMDQMGKGSETEHREREWSGKKRNTTNSLCNFEEDYKYPLHLRAMPDLLDELVNIMGKEEVLVTPQQEEVLPAPEREALVRNHSIPDLDGHMAQDQSFVQPIFKEKCIPRPVQSLVLNLNDDDDDDDDFSSLEDYFDNNEVMTVIEEGKVPLTLEEGKEIANIFKQERESLPAYPPVIILDDEVITLDSDEDDSMEMENPVGQDQSPAAAGKQAQFCRKCKNHKIHRLKQLCSGWKGCPKSGIHWRACPYDRCLCLNCEKVDKMRTYVRQYVDNKKAMKKNGDSNREKEKKN